MREIKEVVSILGPRMTDVFREAGASAVGAFLISRMGSIRRAGARTAVIRSSEVTLRGALIRDTLLIPAVHLQEARRVSRRRNRCHVVAVSADTLGTSAAVTVGT